MNRRHVVVTGLGLVSPVGNSIAEEWANLAVDRSRIATTTEFDPSNLVVHLAGEVKGFNAEGYVPAKKAHNMDTFIHYGIAAGVWAPKGSGLEMTEVNVERIGVLVGSGIGGLPMIEDTHQTYVDRGPRYISPFFIPGSIINMISDHLSVISGLKGSSLAVVTACTTGLHSISLAAHLIQAGDADAVVVGGTESTVSPLGIGGFAATRTLPTCNDDPATASHPWGKNRGGFVLSEGADVMMLEEYELTKARSTTIYAEVVGFDMNGDAFHMIALNMDDPRRCTLNALCDAGIDTDQVYYLSAHGTSTPLGDKSESEAVKVAFGDYTAKIVVNSTKSTTDHSLGGAGSLESVFAVLALHNQVSPPTTNIFNQDPECGPDYYVSTARDMKIDMAAKNNFGFDGTNGMLVFKHP